jgi:uncharacterized lipoprotein YmbA
MAGAKRPLRLAVATLGLALISGCAKSPPTQFFTLDPVTPRQNAQPSSGPPLRIDRVTIPSVMDRPELVREYAADRLKVDDFSHWGAPLGDLMRTTLVEDLIARLPARRILPSGAPTPEGAADLSVEITAIHESSSGLLADIDWAIAMRSLATAGGAPPQVVRTLRHERIEAALNGPSQQAFAAALSQLMGVLADRIAAASPPTS